MAKRRSAAVSLRVGIFLFVILIITSGQALGADHVIKGALYNRTAIPTVS